MLVICDGMPRSASTWSFVATMELLRRTKSQEEIHGAYDEQVATFLHQAPNSAMHLVLKCHALDDLGRALAQCRAAKVVYTWREPFDAIVSCMRMFDYGFEHSLSLIRDSLELYRFHRSQQNALILNYKEITTRPASVTKRLAGYLSLDANSTVIADLSEELSLDRLSAMANTTSARSETPEALSGAGNDVFDPRRVSSSSGHDWKQLLLRHIRHGGSGYGESQLTAEQVRLVKELKMQLGFFD